ncbi:MAG: GNAT family N-acetyltransferase [Planctomycetota bacterium]|jgi:GNAT superfamily N-acetyltransferase
MSFAHPSATRLEALHQRWQGQDHRLQAIARSLRRGEDWTVHLRGLPMVEEIPPVAGEACGRDLRGADLRRYLRPEVLVAPATERQAALVASISMEALLSNTALPGISPFPVEVESAEAITLAMRRGEHFLLGRCDEQPVGAVRWAERREFQEYTADAPYAEISGLGVLPPWRRGGVGGALMTAAEAQIASDGYPFAVLRTTFELGLVPWYESQGYVIRLTRQHTYPDAPTFLDVVMSKRLRKAEPRPRSPLARRPRIIKSNGTTT